MGNASVKTGGELLAAELRKQASEIDAVEVRDIGRSLLAKLEEDKALVKASGELASTARELIKSDTDGLAELAVTHEETKALHAGDLLSSGQVRTK